MAASLRVLAALGVLGCGRIEFDPNALPPSLVAWYPLDDDIGGTLVDATGHGHDAICQGNCGQLTDGIRGSSMHFDGLGRASVPPASDLETPAGLTVGVWVRVRTPPPDPGVYCIAGKIVGALTDNTWQLRILPTLFVDYLTWGGGVTDFMSNPAFTLVLGRWHHLAAKWDGTVKTLFFDGVAISSRAAPVAFDGQSITLAGDYDYGIPVTCDFVGELDDVRIYSTALAASEIQQLAAP